MFFQRLNFTYEFFNPPGLNWGTILAGEAATGVYGELVNGTIDVITSNSMDAYSINVLLINNVLCSCHFIHSC